MGMDPPHKANRWPRKGNGPPVRRTDGLLIVESTFNCNGSLTALIVGAHAEHLRDGQNVGRQLAQWTVPTSFCEGVALTICGKTHTNQFAIFQEPLTTMLLRKHCDTYGRSMPYTWVLYARPPTNTRA